MIFIKMTTAILITTKMSVLHYLDAQANTTQNNCTHKTLKDYLSSLM